MVIHNETADLETAAPNKLSRKFSRQNTYLEIINVEVPDAYDQDYVEIIPGDCSVTHGWQCQQ